MQKDRTVVDAVEEHQDLPECLRKLVGFFSVIQFLFVLQ